MFKFTPSIISIGLERSPVGIKGASVTLSRKGPSINRLFTLNPDVDNVKQLYIQHPLLTTGIDGLEILTRSLQLPLTKEKDIESALAFQAEPLLPYPIDQAILAYQVIAKNQESTHLILFSARKEAVQTDIEQWQTLRIEPEKVAPVPSALCQFGISYLSLDKTYLILSIQQRAMTCVLIKEGKLLASFALPEGLESLLIAQTEDGLESLPQNEEEWRALSQQKNLQLASALSRFQKNVARMSYALAKELRNSSIEGIAITGQAAEWEGFSEYLAQALNFSLMICEPLSNFPSRELLSYAIPIGLALGSLPGQVTPIDFRQQELAYPNPWYRFKGPLITYFVVILLLSLTFYFFSHSYLSYQEDQLKQAYVELLAGINKSYDQFETTFLAKNAQAYDRFNGEVVAVEKLNQEDLIERLAFLQKELQAVPDSFPLFANIPRVSDVLAWLSQHPTVIYQDENGQSQARLQIENFAYTMLKRPQQGKKQEKYQVKIELEFSSSMPKWAREFHDALIAPNDWVDPKGEVKWSSNRGKYKTSFYLKDKTIYPSS